MLVFKPIGFVLHQRDLRVCFFLTATGVGGGVRCYNNTLKDVMLCLNCKCAVRIYLGNPYNKLVKKTGGGIRLRRSGMLRTI